MASICCIHVDDYNVHPSYEANNCDKKQRHFNNCFLILLCKKAFVSYVTDLLKERLKK